MATDDLIPHSYWESLETLYRADDASDWLKARPVLENILPTVAEKLAPRYTFAKALDKGGAGLISKIIDNDLTRLQKAPDTDVVYRALKLALPIAIRQDLLNDIIIHEFTTLACVTHTNIIKLYSAGQVESDGVKCPFYIMDYIKDATKSFEYLSRPDVSFDALLRLIQETCQAVAFLFQRNILHNDIKPSNILVDGERAILSDLGSAIGLEDPTKAVTITFTARYAHPVKKEHAIASKDENRMRRTAPAGDFKRAWDLYSLGLTVLELLEGFAKTHPGKIPAYEYRYLRLLGSRLLDAQISAEQFRAYPFPKPFYIMSRYTDIDQVLEDINKITGQYSPEKAVPELAIYSESTLQVGMFGPTALTDRLRELIRHPALKRLASISQLGFLVFLYPGATHVRAEHSLGVYCNAVRIINALWRDPINPLFRQIMTEEDLAAGLLAALIHDVGQYPLAHDLEEAYETFFRHEQIGFQLMEQRIEGQESLVALIDRLWPAPGGSEQMSVRVIRILKARSRDATCGLKDQILHSIIDGPIDADKLDYLVRDSKKLGVTYGLAIDFERLTRVITVIHEYKAAGMVAYLGVHERGKISAEAIGFARYSMFGAVYLHRSSRAVKSMLHIAAWDIFRGHGDLKAMRQEFQDVIVHNRLPAIQQELFAEADKHDMARALWPGFNLADQQMLAWLWQNCTSRGRSVLEVLSSGVVYERAYVLGHDGKEEEELWKLLNKFAGKASPSDRLDFDGKVEQGIVSYLFSLSGSERTRTEAIDDPSLQTVVTLRQRLPIVFVDIPVDRSEGMRELRFFAEAGRWKYDEDDLVNIGVGSSDVWDALVETFHKSLGKVRVFVHPKVKRTMRAVPALEWKRALENALAG